MMVWLIHWFIFPGGGGSDYFCADIVYMHMDLNHRVLWGEPYQYHLTLNMHFSRYILLGNSYPGTAGSCRLLRRHSRQSAIILACRHIGIGLSVIHLSFPCVYDSDGCLDAPHFYDSSFWKDFDPASGVGGWGNPNTDFEVPNGGFHSLPLSYPSPHTVRRNFTLLPFNVPYPFFTEPRKMANSSFSASAIEAILRTAAGNYKGFQTALEAFEVRSGHK